jgi:pimeloyl-ACP methyl ester carboxylesterase
MFTLDSSLVRIALVPLLAAWSCAPSPDTARKSGDQKSGETSAADAKAGDESERPDDGADELGSKNGDEKDDGDEKDEPSSATPKERQRIEFAGSKGDKVPGYLWLPAAKAGKKAPAILLMYGISDDKDSGTIAAAAQELQKKGYASLTIDWPGTGERGSISKQERVINASVKDWTVADYVKAVDFLAKRPEVDAGRIGYVGASMGAMTGLAYAARDKRIKAVVAIVPIPNPLWGGDDPQSSIRAVAPRPVLCISTQDNSDFSGTVCAKNAGENKVLSGGHELEGMRGQVVELTEAFFAKHLN